MLRYRRQWDSAGRRRYYRKIFFEKKRLILQGVDHEEIRLLCRYLANLKNNAAKDRFLAYQAQMRLSLLWQSDLT
jgi:hypothetical protein